MPANRSVYHQPRLQLVRHQLLLEGHPIRYLTPLFAFVAQYLQERAIVSVFMENGVATVTTIQHVVTNIPDGGACCARHQESIAKSA